MRDLSRWLRPVRKAQTFQKLETEVDRGKIIAYEAVESQGRKCAQKSERLLRRLSERNTILVEVYLDRGRRYTTKWEESVARDARTYLRRLRGYEDLLDDLYGFYSELHTDTRNKDVDFIDQFPVICQYVRIVKLIDASPIDLMFFTRAAFERSKHMEDLSPILNATAWSTFVLY